MTVESARRRSGVRRRGRGRWEIGGRGRERGTSILRLVVWICLFRFAVDGDAMEMGLSGLGYV